MEMETQVQPIFLNFTKGEKEMDGRCFSKVCRDSKLYDKVYTPTDADLLFARLKPKGGRKIDFPIFVKCLQAIAEKKKCAAPEVYQSIVDAGGPIYSGTKALPTKFHDDKSLYTGVHARVAPKTVNTGRRVFDLSVGK